MRTRLGAVVVLVLVAAAVFAGWRVFTPTPPLEEGPLIVDIPAHGGVVEIADGLHRAGAIRSRAAFVALGVIQGRARSLKAGEYELPRGATTSEILALIAGGTVRQHAVLHPEGGTVLELARALESQRLAVAAEVVRAASDPQLLRTLAVDARSLEGYLFPDTYQLVRGLAPEEILTRMVQRLRAKLTPQTLARAAERKLTLHQLLTLASIVEREAAVPEERPLISAVFWNRLRREMPLQADPTVQYAVRKERGTLTRADLQTDDPYNTYRWPGLPPGPIASPGLAAIEATLAPAPVPYLYFVATDERRHQFSVTIEEHNAAVARYRLSRQRGEGS